MARGKRELGRKRCTCRTAEFHGSCMGQEQSSGEAGKQRGSDFLNTEEKLLEEAATKPQQGLPEIGCCINGTGCKSADPEGDQPLGTCPKC